MTVDFLAIYDTEEKRLAYCFMLMEKLRWMFNDMGMKYRAGKITEEQWRQWQDNYYEPREDKVNEALLTYKAKVEAKHTKITKGIIDNI